VISKFKNFLPMQEFSTFGEEGGMGLQKRCSRSRGRRMKDDGGQQLVAAA